MSRRLAVATSLRPWLPAMAGMTCLGLGIGLVSMFGFFVPHLSREFGVGVAAINMAPVALLLVPGILSPFLGKLVDRWSIRGLMLLGSAASMLSLLVLSQAQSLLVLSCAFLLFAVGLVCYGPLAVNALMVKLYPGREARALAVASLGISVSSITLPVFVGAVLQVLDWRSSLRCCRWRCSQCSGCGCLWPCPPEWWRRWWRSVKALARTLPAARNSG